MKKIIISILGAITLLITGCGELGYSDVESELKKIKENTDKVKFLNEKISSKKILDEDIKKVLTLKEKIEQDIKIQNEINGYRTKINIASSYEKIANLQKEIDENKIIPENEKTDLNLRLKNNLSDKFVGDSVTPERLEKNYKDIVSAGLLNDRIKELYGKVKESLERELRNQYGWETGDYVNDFGEKTGDHFIYTNTEGTFENSATKNSKLYVTVMADKTSIDFKLKEYFTDRQEAWFNDYQKPYLLAKNEKGDKIKITLSTYGKSPYAYGNEFKRLDPFFKKSNSLKIVIRDNYSNVYNFEINTRFYKK